MDCPACERALSHMVHEGVELDACKGGCGGVWFDAFELKKFDEPHEAAGAALLDLERDPGVELDHQARRRCPRCDEPPVMMQHFFGAREKVEVDTCPGCGGVWLDAGELARIRDTYESEEERKQAAWRLVADSDDQLERMAAESEEKTEQARRIAGFFRWLYPSYWIPGKQRWGAY